VTDIIELAQSEFPRLLQEISDPPKRLFIRGKLPPETYRTLTVVGPRKYSTYGKEVCHELIKGLSGYPIVIVSGLAFGIDTIAHNAALDAQLTTIAFPGSGLHDDVLYPRANKKLARNILDSGGALISESEPNFRAQIWSFPKRNRLMVGVSHAVLMIEAREQSGTLITARLTSDYNRELLTVPGSIFSDTSYGPHLFMRLGATPIRTSEDILEALGLEKRETKSKNLELSENEQLVFDIIQEPCTRDELIRSLNLSTSKATILLSSMELKGIISEQGGVIRIT